MRWNHSTLKPILVIWIVTNAFYPPTCFPCMEEVWQRDTQISGQRKRLPEVPESPPTVLPANLQTMSCQLEVSQQTVTTYKRNVQL